MERIAGVTTVNQLMVSATTADDIDPVQAAVTSLLEQRHRIVPPAQDDFQVRNLQSIAVGRSQTGAVMEFLLAGVAAVSLVVGGIGIMNIMMVSVTERTRKSACACPSGRAAARSCDQFLTEAIVLSTIGGMIGVVSGSSRRPRRCLRTVADGHSAGLGGDLDRILGARRNLLRLLSGEEGRRSQPDRGPAVRIIQDVPPERMGRRRMTPAHDLMSGAPGPIGARIEGLTFAYHVTYSV